MLLGNTACWSMECGSELVFQSQEINRHRVANLDHRCNYCCCSSEIKALLGHYQVRLTALPYTARVSYRIFAGGWRLVWNSKLKRIKQRHARHASSGRGGGGGGGGGVWGHVPSP